MRIRLTLWLAFWLAGIVSATTLAKLSLDDMIQRSSAIVRGQVLSTAAIQQGPVIFTTYQFKVSEQLKGSLNGVVTVVVWGGQLNGVRQSFPGAPKLDVGGQYAIFVWTSPSGLNHIIGLSQGLFNLTADAQGNLILTRGPIQAELVDASGKPVNSTSVRLTWQDLGERVRRTLGAAQ
jgi:hypothetical protein